MIDPSLFQETRYPQSGLALILQAIAQARQFQSQQAQLAQERQQQEAYQRLQLLHGIVGQYTAAGQEPPQEILGGIDAAQQALGLPGVARQQVPIPGTGASAIAPVPAGPPVIQGAGPMDTGVQGTPALPGVAAVPPQTQAQYVYPTRRLLFQTLGDMAKGLGTELRPGVSPDLRIPDLLAQNVDINALFVRQAPPENVAFLDTRTGEIVTQTFPAGTKVEKYASPGQPTQYTILKPDGSQTLLPPGIVPHNAPTVPKSAVPPEEKITPALRATILQEATAQATREIMGSKPGAITALAALGPNPTPDQVAAALSGQITDADRAAIKARAEEIANYRIGFAGGRPPAPGVPVEPMPPARLALPGAEPAQYPGVLSVPTFAGGTPAPSPRAPAPRAVPRVPPAALPGGLPDPRANRGRIVRDTQTGNRFQSNGTAWVPLP